MSVDVYGDGAGGVPGEHLHDLGVHARPRERSEVGAAKLVEAEDTGVREDGKDGLIDQPGDLVLVRRGVRRGGAAALRGRGVRVRARTGVHGARLRPRDRGLVEALRRERDALRQ